MSVSLPTQLKVQLYCYCDIQPSLSMLVISLQSLTLSAKVMSVHSSDLSIAAAVKDTTVL